MLHFLSCFAILFLKLSFAIYFLFFFGNIFQQELPNGARFDKVSANNFIGKAAEISEAAHETCECAKTLLRTRGVKF